LRRISVPCGQSSTPCCLGRPHSSFLYEFLTTLPLLLKVVL
jgi:hypothetical protein